jgi:hypothetical protein
MPSGPVKHRNTKSADAAINRNAIIRTSFIPELISRIASDLMLQDLFRIADAS